MERDSAYRNLDEDAYDMIALYTKSKELLEIKNENKEGESVNMCQAIKEMLEDERSEGREEGRAEERKNTEQERKKAEMERKKAEQERKKAEMERKKAEQERNKAEQERKNTQKAVLNLCREFGATKEQIIRQLMEKCSLDRKTAEILAEA